MYDIVLGRSAGDTKKHQTKGTVMIGKQYVQMGDTSSLSNPIYLDVARAHAMLIVGKRGGGKCLDGNSKIVLDSGELIKIKDLEKNNDKILSINDTYKINSYDKTQFYSRKSKELYSITLRTGKTLKLTPEHPLLTVNNWEQVKNLNIGSRIATPRNLPVEGKFPIGISKAKLLGYFIAEGHLGNKFILFSNKDKAIIEDFSKAIKVFDKNLLLKNHSKDTLRVIQNKKRKLVNNLRNEKGQFLENNVFDSKSTLRKWLDEIGVYNCNSFEKFVPKSIFTTPNSEVKEFLKVLFSCDGSIYKENKNYWKISYSSVSQNLVEEISHLLLRFGIVSKIRNKPIKYNSKKYNAYEIEIKGEFVQTFIEKINFIGDKEKKANIAYQSLNKIINNPNKDTIPKQIWERYKPSTSWSEIGKKLSYKHPKALRESTRYSPSRKKLYEIGKYDENTEIQNLANSDIYWDEITHIEKLVGNHTVYDLTCPDFNNFVANDVVVHNSYTMGSIAEGLAGMEKDVAENLSFVLLDTMGVYWSMKYPNKKESDLLKKWGLEGEGFDVQIYVPGGFFKKYQEDGVPVDYPFYIQPRELSVEDWMNAFKLHTDDPVGVAVQRIVNIALESEESFGLDDLIQYTKDDERLDEQTKLAVENRFENARTWGIFSKKGTPIKDLLTGGKVTVMDLSPYVAMPGGWDVKSLTLGIISKKIFVHRMLVRKREELFDIINKTQVVKEEEVKEDLPMPWLIVDEAHEFLPSEGTVPSSQSLITILREGRQPGVSLILATQQPAKIHTDAITQSDIVLAHRLTASFDLEALDKIFLSYNNKGSKALFNSMPRTKGCAIIMDDKNERLHTMQVKPRTSWHGGEDPSAIREVKDEFDLD